MDPSKPLNLKLELDKAELKRTRNRVNQRNYRRRKSEQAKEALNRKLRMKSASGSPGTGQIERPESTFGGSDSASQRGVSTNMSQVGDRLSSWLTFNQGFSESLDSVMMPANVTTGGRSSLEYCDDSATALGSSKNQDSAYAMDIKDWQRTGDLQNQLASSEPSRQQSDRPSSDSPNPNAIRQPLDTPTNVSLYSGKTTLHLAAENGNRQSVRVLLSYGADPNLKDSKGCTALHVAVAGGHVDTVVDLINARCDLNATDFLGRTALHLAAEGNHPQMVGLLLRAGGDPNAQISNR